MYQKDQMAPTMLWIHWFSLQRGQLLDHHDSVSEKQVATSNQYLLRALEDKRNEKRWSLLFRSSWCSWEGKVNIHEGKSRPSVRGIQTREKSCKDLEKRRVRKDPWDQRSKNHILSCTRIHHHTPFCFTLPDFMTLYQGFLLRLPSASSISEHLLWKCCKGSTNHKYASREEPLKIVSCKIPMRLPS